MVEDIFQTMNTVAQIKTEGKDKNFALAEAKAIILDFEKRFNFYSKDSEISKLCAHIHVGERYNISHELHEILLTAKKIRKETGGLFDVDFMNKEEHKDYHLENCDTIIFDSNKTKLNLGGIAKGFAADEAIEKIKEFDVDRAMISLGGHIACLSSTEPWKLGLQNPDEDFGQLMATVEISNGSLSTSAENYRGKHIKNPTKTDWSSTVKSLSVFNESGYLADAYSTALFLADDKTRRSLVQRDKLDVIIIDGEQIYLTEHLSKKIVLVDDKYKTVTIEEF